MPKPIPRKLIGILLTITIFSSASATNYYVRQIGNDNQNGLTPQTAWKTLAKACSANLQPGDTVFIGPGNYNETLTPTKNGTVTAPIVWYGDYTGQKTGDLPGRVAVGGYAYGTPQFVPQSATNHNFTFYLDNITVLPDGNYEVQTRITNKNNKNFSYAIFSLPVGTSALWPPNGSTYSSPLGPWSYTITNPVTNPFYGIKYTTIGTGIINGQTDLFKYHISPSQLAMISSIRILAKAGNVTGNVNLPVIFSIPGAISVSVACNISSRSNLVCQGITFGKTTNKGINITNSSNIAIKDCDIQEITNYGIYVDGWATTEYFEFTADTILSGAVGGIYINLPWPSTPPNFSINNNYIANCNDGLYVYCANILTLNDNVINSCSRRGIYLYNVFNEINSIANNEIKGCEAEGLYIRNTTVKSITNNRITKVGSHGIYIYDNTTSHTVGRVNYNQIDGIANSGKGIYIDRLTIKEIIGNVVSNGTSDGIAFNGNYSYAVGKIDSNLVHHCTNNGIFTNAPLSVETINANTLYSLNMGIVTTSGNYYTIGEIKNNRLFSYATRGISCSNVQNSLFENNHLYKCTGSTNTYGIYLRNDNNQPITIKNNTLFQSGYYGIYGFCIQGDWRNNIVTGSYYGIYGANYSFTPIPITARYNCAYANSVNYTGVVLGPGNINVDPFFVDPDGADNILGGDNWADDDFHLKSSGGSWHFGQWLPDEDDSPCIDTGDPNDDYSNEPEDNGDRINIGCYGNTSQASKKPNRPITVTFHDLPGSKWVMLGVPVAPTEGTPPGEPLTIFGDDLGTNTPGDWYLIHWVTNDSTAEYFEYNDGTIYQPPTPYPGLGYFIWQGKYRSVDLDVTGKPVGNCALEVAQAPHVDWYSKYGPMLGYNQFANPYEFTIDWSNSEIWNFPNMTWDDNQKQVLSLQEAADQGLISRYAYIWNHNLDQYEIVVPNPAASSDTLSVWQGFYFIQVDSISNLKLHIPRMRALQKTNQFSQILATKDSKFHFRSSSVSPAWQWFLKLGVTVPDLNLRDTENGIGVAATANEGFDSWDAFDLRGISSAGKYVQLEFPHQSGPTFAYDLRPDFAQSRTWKFRVNTSKTNLKQKARLVWPHIRLVPENIKFSLLASDSSTVLLDDLRQFTHYEYKITDSSMTFYVRAHKVSDTNSPQFKFVFHQNPLLPQDLTFYIVPSEPLTEVRATINNITTTLSTVDSPPYIYYGKMLLSGSGALQIAATGKDLANNSGSGTANLQYQITKPGHLTKIVASSGEITLTVSEGALPANTLICLTRAALDIEPLSEATPIGEPIYIGPEGLQPLKPLILHLFLPETNKSLVLYRYHNGNWQPVGLAQPEMQLSRTGIYQLGETSNAVTIGHLLPQKYALETCYPNPFNSNILIRYAMPTFGKVQVKIYDILGREVRELCSNLQSAGYHQLLWDGTNNFGASVATGIYYINLTISKDDRSVFNTTRKITLVK